MCDRFGNAVMSTDEALDIPFILLAYRGFSPVIQVGIFVTAHPSGDCCCQELLGSCVNSKLKLCLPHKIGFRCVSEMVEHIDDACIVARLRQARIYDMHGCI